MGKIMSSPTNLNLWPRKEISISKIEYIGQFISVIHEPTSMPKKICEKKLKSSRPTHHHHLLPYPLQCLWYLMWASCWLPKILTVFLSLLFPLSLSWQLYPQLSFHMTYPYHSSIQFLVPFGLPGTAGRHLYP